MAGAKPMGFAGIAVAMAGIAVPVAVGAWTGHLGAGMVAAVGGLAMSEAGEGDSLGAQLRDIAYAFVASMAAMLVGSWVARSGVAGAAALVVIAAAVSLVGGMSRPLARATTRFVLFMVMTSYLSARGGSTAPIGLFLAGALWAAILALAVKTLRRTPPAATPAEGAVKRKPAVRQLWTRWTGTLSTFAGWSYATQIAVCLAIAEAIRIAWPEHHTYWVALTVVIVVRRQGSELRARASQRAAGTAFGVVIGSLLLAWPVPAWVLVLAIAVIAALRPILKARNYLAYSAVMTPLIVMMMEFGQPATPMVMVDRLAATLAGCVLALAAGRWLRAGKE